MEKRNYAEITPEITRMAGLCEKSDYIEPSMYANYKVYRGLRDLNGKGVLTGLTEISEIHAKDFDEQGREIPCAGELFYRGYNVKELVKGFTSSGRFGFEETAYLLLFLRRHNIKSSVKRLQAIARFRIHSFVILL